MKSGFTKPVDQIHHFCGAPRGVLLVELEKLPTIITHYTHNNSFSNFFYRSPFSPMSRPPRPAPLALTGMSSGRRHRRKLITRCRELGRPCPMASSNTDCYAPRCWSYPRLGRTRLLLCSRGPRSTVAVPACRGCLARGGRRPGRSFFRHWHLGLS